MESGHQIGREYGEKNDKTVTKDTLSLYLLIFILNVYTGEDDDSPLGLP